MKIAIAVLAVLVVLVLLVVLIGYSLPVAHRASRQVRLAVPADSVFAAISNVRQYPAWRKSVTRVETLADVDGKARFREVTGNGAITYSVDENVPGKRRVTRIGDPSLPFGGKWTYEVTPDGAGSTLRITEDGEVYNPIFRLMSRTVFPTHKTIETFLSDLGARLGVPVQITE